MKVKKYRYFMGDFETTVYDGQKSTEVWASAVVELFTEDVRIHHSISETFEYLETFKEDITIYYHNLKFDGSFWLSFLMLDCDIKQAIDENKNWIDDKKMKQNSFKYMISNMGQWYSITIRTKNHIIRILDSLKLLPFSVKRIGKSFKTRHKKLEMEYKGFRYAGCEITDEEKEYIANDVLVVKEALEIMFEENHNKLTIGACCLTEYKNIVGRDRFTTLFPQLYNVQLNTDVYGQPTAGDYIRKSYRGGWCYIAKGKEKKIYTKGLTVDVNSLYPSMMSSESGNQYPYGSPIFWKGNYIPFQCTSGKFYFFVRLTTRFKLKDGYLPFIQIKGNWLYKPTDSLETSDIYDEKTGEYHTEYIDKDGEVKQARVTMTLTCTDYALLQEHYHLYDTEILDGCYFKQAMGLFDEYIDRYKKLKQTSTGARRELAKLFLNNLYGKMATSQNSSFKVAYIKDDFSVGFLPVEKNDKEAGFIAVGSAITSYARNFTIRAAQMNYYGKDKRGFIYADTDSVHADLEEHELKGIRLHDTDFCAWKIESNWDIGWYTRQKTYIEHIISTEEPEFLVKCAGMTDRCKSLFIASLEGMNEQEWKMNNKELWDTFNKEEQEFITTKRTVEDFDVGLKVPSKLMPKRIRGGTLLVDTYFEMR